MAKETRQQLVNRLRAERDPKVLGQYVHHPAWQVRWEAIESLGKSGDPGAEGPLLELHGSDPDPMDYPFLHVALGQVGSQAAIPALVALIHHSKDDVKSSAIAALQELGDATLTPIYLDALTDRSWVAKAYAMRAIAVHGDERAVDPVCRRVRSALSKERRTKFAGMTEVTYALEYLRRWRTSHPAADTTITWVRTRTFERLQPDERVWFASTFVE